MRRWLILGLMLGLLGPMATSFGQSDDKAKEQSKPAANAKADPEELARLREMLAALRKIQDEEPAKLKIGDPAPVLKITKWLKGTEVKDFASSKVYVVDFWSTWSKPSIASMPHLSKLQAKYASKGLTIIGVTTKSSQNSEAKVDEFMKQNGEKYLYSLAYCEDHDTHTAFMKAANRSIMPCSFVIDKSGKIAYIGHPTFLDEILPKVLAGTWKGQADIDALAKADEQLSAIVAKAQTKGEEAVKELAEFEINYPEKTKQSSFPMRKLLVLAYAKKLDDARKLSEILIGQAEAKKDKNTLLSLASLWSSPAMNPGKKHTDIAVKAAEILVKITENNDKVLAYYAAAVTHHSLGQTEKYEDYAQKALNAAKGTDLEGTIQQRLGAIKKQTQPGIR